MSRYEVEFTATITLTVSLDAHDEVDASEAAWGEAVGYLNTIAGQGPDLRAYTTEDDLIEVEVREKPA